MIWTVLCTDRNLMMYDSFRMQVQLITDGNEQTDRETSLNLSEN